MAQELLIQETLSDCERLFVRRHVACEDPPAHLPLGVVGAHRARLDEVAAPLGAAVEARRRAVLGAVDLKKRDHNVRYGESGVQHVGEMGWVGETQKNQIKM